MEEVIRGPANITTLTGYQLGLTELRSPYKSKNRRWVAQRNVVASSHIRDHEVIWSDLSSAEGGSEPEYDETHGSGRGLGFVKTLQAGDRIALVARALVSPISHFLFPTLLLIHTVSGLGKSRPQRGDRSHLQGLISLSIFLQMCSIPICVQEYLRPYLNYMLLFRLSPQLSLYIQQSAINS